MASSKQRPDKAVEQIRKLLEPRYRANHPQATVTVKRRDLYSIWVRIIDPDLKGTSIVERDEEAWAILRELPEDTLQQISLLFLLTPQEAKTSILNQDFENPIPTRLE